MIPRHPQPAPPAAPLIPCSTMAQDEEAPHRRTTRAAQEEEEAAGEAALLDEASSDIASRERQRELEGLRR